MTNRKESIVTLATGIASLVFGLNMEAYGVCAIIGLVCGIICLVFSKKAYAAGAENKMLKTGKILGIIGLVLSIIGLVIGIVCIACVCTGAIGAAAMDSLNY